MEENRDKNKGLQIVHKLVFGKIQLLLVQKLAKIKKERQKSINTRTLLLTATM